MESFFTLIDNMDTLLNVNRVLVYTFIITALMVYFGIVIREDIFQSIATFVWYIMLLRFCLKKNSKDLTTCSQETGFFSETEFQNRLKRRARIDATEDVPILDQEKSSSDSADNSDTVLPEVPELPKKNRRRQKKRKHMNKSRFKSMMDDSSETSSNSSDTSLKSDALPEKTKIYLPLPIYQQLKLDDFALHRELKYYLLTKEELRINGFPEESIEYPGRAVLKHQRVEKGSTKRHCCRCTSIFHILPDGQYEAKEPCRYHLKKQVPFRSGHPYHGDFPCCNGNYLSKGCVTWQYHVTQESALEDVVFVKTKHKKHLSKKKANTVYALDCEMLYTTAGMEVAKVGIVGINGLTIFESFVLPQNPILDYNTLYSGVTEKDLKDVSMTLADVQAYLLKLLNQESILVGHGLENDLKALRLIHDNVVDTSVVFPHQHTKRHKKSLKNLALEFLGKEIQQSNSGHNCIEDARTCLELMLCKVRQDMKDRPLVVVQDENKNTNLLQNTHPTTTTTAVEYCTPKFTYCPAPWSYNCNYPSYCSDAYRNNFYSGYLTPKIHHSCIY